jgi:hypothetical protein
MALFERDALRLIDRYIRVGDSVATYYVDPVSGSNSDTGLTRALAWADFTHINDGTMSPNDFVLLMAGTHTDAFVPTESGSSGNVFTVMADDGRDDGAGPVSDATNTGPVAGDKTATPVVVDGTSEGTVHCITIGSQDYWHFSGFAIRNFEKAGAKLDTSVGCQLTNMQIKNNNTTSADAVTVDGTTDCTIDNCEINANGVVDSHGIGILGVGGTDADNLTIKRCNIHDNYDDVIKLRCKNSTIEDNNIHSQYGPGPVHQDGLVLQKATNVVVQRNHFYDCSQLIYGPLKDEVTFVWDGVYIHSNVFYATRAYQDFGSPEPPYSNTLVGVFVDNDPAAGAGSILRDVHVFSNSFGYLGLKAVLIDCDTTPTIRTGVRVYNNEFFDPRNGASEVVDVSANVADVSGDYNCYYVCNVWATDGGNGITSNPLDVDYNGKAHAATFDFRPTGSSPKLTAGHTNIGTVVTLPSPWTDRNGDTRDETSGTIGAYENVGSNEIALVLAG